MWVGLLLIQAFWKGVVSAVEAREEGARAGAGAREEGAAAGTREEGAGDSREAGGAEGQVCDGGL
eukprot:1161981-Pelagomonas_calceolata.AAC.14